MSDEELQALVTSQIRLAVAPQKPRFDPTITLGSLLTIVTMVLAAFGGYLAFHDSIRDVQRETAANSKSIADTNQVVQTQAKTVAQQSQSLEKLTWIVESLERSERAGK